MGLPDKVDCSICEENTENYYVIKTNKGDIYRCAECFEIMYMRQQRDEYSNYSDKQSHSKKN